MLFPWLLGTPAGLRGHGAMHQPGRHPQGGEEEEGRPRASDLAEVHRQRRREGKARSRI